MLLWGIQDGEHLLQHIIRFRLKKLLQAKYGVEDHSWMFNPCRTASQPGTKVWNNIIQARSKTKIVMSFYRPRQQSKLQDLSLWIRGVLHKKPGLASCKTNAQKGLKAAGLETIRDITDGRGTLLEWDALPNAQLLRRHHRAYNKLCEGLTWNKWQSFLEHREDTFMTRVPFQEENTVWQYRLEPSQVKERWQPGELTEPAWKCFTINGFRLLQIPDRVAPDVEVHQILVGSTTGGETKSKISLEHCNQTRAL
jgi:hypothetical protein